MFCVSVSYYFLATIQLQLIIDIFQLQLECWPMPNAMAAQRNVGAVFCESSVIPLLVPRRKVWLTPAAGVPCSNAANIGERKIGRKVNFAPGKIPPDGSSPPKMYILYIVYQARRRPNIVPKSGWPQVTDAAAVTKARRETG